jgi:peptidyl-tRNA hydrolase, PTH2 family
MKVALQTRTEDELLMLQAAALSLSLTAKVVHDAGRTQIAAGTATVLGIGPGPRALIDKVTGDLRLL